MGAERGRIRTANADNGKRLVRDEGGGGAVKLQ